MKKSRILLMITIFGIILPSQACNLARVTVYTPPSVQSTTSSPITNASPAATPPIATHLPTLMTTPLPPGLSSASPIAPTHTSAPTRTSVPFLPTNLVLISPQNISKLKPVAVLPEQSASVVAYSPDSQRIAAGLFGSNLIKIWDLASGQVGVEDRPGGGFIFWFNLPKGEEE